MNSEPDLKVEPGIRAAQSRTQDSSPLSSHGNPLSSRVHWQVSAGPKVEPGRMLRQSGTQAPAPPSVSPTGHSSTQAPAPPSISPTGHVQVSPGTKDEPDKMLAQSSMQAPAPSSTKSPGHVHVLPTKVDPVKKLSQLSVQVAPFGQMQVSPSDLSRVDPGKTKSQFVAHFKPSGPDPGRLEKSFV